MLFLALSVAMPIRSWEIGDEEECPATGIYDNLYYGFRVKLPRGLKGCPNSPVGMSDHGVLIPLDSEGQRVIEVYAGYNAMFYETARDAASNTIDFFREKENYDSVSVLSRSRTTLGGLAAERIVLRYRVKSDGLKMIFDSTTVLRSVTKSTSEPSHQYSVSLTTTADRYVADRSTLDRVLASWKPTATEDDPKRPTRRSSGPAKNPAGH